MTVSEVIERAKDIVRNVQFLDAAYIDGASVAVTLDDLIEYAERLTAERDAAVERATKAEEVVMKVVAAWDHYSASLSYYDMRTGKEVYSADDEAIHEAFGVVSDAVRPYHQWRATPQPAAPAQSAAETAETAHAEISFTEGGAFDYHWALANEACDEATDFDGLRSAIQHILIAMHDMQKGTVQS